jgi:putative redox protein
MEALARWDAGMAFNVCQDGHDFTIDAASEFGGLDRGPRPKGLLLSGLAGCTGMDVISVLRKMRVEFQALKVRVEADLTEEHPKVFSRIHIQYAFQGRDLPLDKLEKAVTLSQERYCGVSAMLRLVCPITWEITRME